MRDQCRGEKALAKSKNIKINTHYRHSFSIKVPRRTVGGSNAKALDSLQRLPNARPLHAHLGEFIFGYIADVDQEKYQSQLVVL